MILVLNQNTVTNPPGQMCGVCVFWELTRLNLKRWQRCEKCVSRSSLKLKLFSCFCPSGFNPTVKPSKHAQSRVPTLDLIRAQTSERVHTSKNMSICHTSYLQRLPLVTWKTNNAFNTFERPRGFTWCVLVTNTKNSQFKTYNQQTQGEEKKHSGLCAKIKSGWNSWWRLWLTYSWFLAGEFKSRWTACTTRRRRRKRRRALDQQHNTGDTVWDQHMWQRLTAARKTDTRPASDFYHAVKID